MKKRSKTKSRGVRVDKNIDNIRYYYNKRGNSKSRGVRKDGYVLCYRESKQKTNIMLFYSKPCVCGSLRHATTRHIDCVLNGRYDDK